MENTKSKLFWLLLILGLATLMDHSYLTHEYYNLHSGLSEGPSMCNISSKFNCDAVAASQYAKLAGIPMALLGALTQAALLLLLLLGHFGIGTNPSQTRRYFFWGTCFVLFVSIIMASISTFKIGTYCLFCMGAYLLSLLSFALAFYYSGSQAAPHLQEDLGDLFSRSKWVLAIILAIPASGFIANGVIGSNYNLEQMQPLIHESIESWKTAPEQKFNLSEGLIEQSGTQPAALTIVEFADFRCPHCRMAYPGLEAFAQGHPDVKLIFKSFPLDGTCNKAVTRTGDGLTCKLALTAFCAEELSQKGWEAHHWIYDRQEQFQSVSDFPDRFHQLCQDLKLDEQKMNDCLTQDATTQKIQAMAAEGANAKIEGTPTLFVNNKLYKEGQFLPFMDALYQEIKAGSTATK